MAEPFMWLKALDFSATSLGKSTSSVVKGMLVLTAVCFLVIGIRGCFKKPLPTTTQTADKIENKNFYLQPHALGCARLIVQPEKK